MEEGEMVEHVEGDTEEQTVNGRNWLTIDEFDPRYRLIQEDELEEEFFGESPSSGEDDCDTEEVSEPETESADKEYEPRSVKWRGTKCRTDFS